MLGRLPCSNKFLSGCSPKVVLVSRPATASAGMNRSCAAATGGAAAPNRAILHSLSAMSQIAASRQVPLFWMRTLQHHQHQQPPQRCGLASAIPRPAMQSSVVAAHRGWCQEVKSGLMGCGGVRQFHQSPRTYW